MLRRRLAARLLVAAFLIAATAYARPTVAAQPGDTQPGDAQPGDSGPDPAGQSATEVRAGFTALIERGDHGGLLRAADVALLATPQSVLALEHRAYALQRLRRDLEAADAYARVLKAQPDHAWALTQLGWIEAEIGRHAASAAHLRRAIELTPDSLDAHRKLVAVLRASGDLGGALAQVAASRAAGLDPAWSWREQAELEWMSGNERAASAALGKAGRAGAADLERLRELLAFDAELLRGQGNAAAFREQRAAGTPWEFDVGEVHVVSTVGPVLPKNLERMLRELPDRFADLVGSPPPRSPSRPPRWDRGGGRETASRLVLYVSRTTEQHEVLRRRYFPQGSRGRAFTGGVSGTPGRGSAGDIGIYVAWTAPDIATSMAHELGHAAIRRSAFGVPLWLDEGIATYVENLRSADDDPEPWRDELRSELTSALRSERALSWEEMLSAERPAFEGANGRERYAQAWSMVRFLLLADEMGADAATRRERLRAILTPARNGGAFRVSGGKALIAATYGLSVGEIDAAWRRHVGAPKRD